MAQMFCGILEKFGIEHKVSPTTAGGLEELEAYKPQLVILDSSVDNGTGMQFITAITPVIEEKETRKERRKKLDSGPSVMVVRTIYETVPTDCPFVKASLVRPFTAEQLSDAIKALIPKEKKAEVPKLFSTQHASDPETELERMKLTYGESYVVFEERPIIIHQVMQVFANAGYDMLLLTHLRASVAREKYGLDMGAEVFTLSGSNYPLGTMITAVQDFLGKKKKPLIAFGDLDNIIEHCGVDLTMRSIQQILSLRKSRGKFTLLTSVDDSLLTDNVRRLLTEMMIEYDKED